MAQEKPRTIGEALKQADNARIRAADASPDALDRIVMQQIADALIGIQWWMERIATSLSSEQTRMR
jgi:hypothetical protein